ncbi:hypothetical protein HYW76_05380 [Candidatus Pacearchaeota archaeon]|nr:hypothetical protein [Candidatus Pacearchaeota archaeon]
MLPKIRREYWRGKKGDFLKKLREGLKEHVELARYARCEDISGGEWQSWEADFNEVGVPVRMKIFQGYAHKGMVGVRADVQLSYGDGRIENEYLKDIRAKLESAGLERLAEKPIDWFLKDEEVKRSP